MKDIVLSAVRTGVQVGVASLVAWLGSLGIDLGEIAIQLEMALFAVLAAIVTFLLNLLGTKFPWINTLFSLGISSSSPNYTEADYHV